MSAYCWLLSLTNEILLVNEYERRRRSGSRSVSERDGKRSRVHFDNLTEMFIHHIWKFSIEWAYFNSVVTKARCRVCIQNTNGYSRFSIIICIFWIFPSLYVVMHEIMMKTLVPIEIHCNGIEKLPSIKWENMSHNRWWPLSVNDRVNNKREEMLQFHFL